MSLRPTPPPSGKVPRRHVLRGAAIVAAGLGGLARRARAAAPVLRISQWTHFVPGYDECGYDGYFVGWQSVLTPDIDLGLGSTAPFNYTQYYSAEFDALADDWRTTHDLASRLEKAEEIQWFLHEDEPILVLLYVNLRVKAGGVTKDSLRAELRATGPTPMA